MARKATRAKFLVGLLGESPNDTASVQALLRQRYDDRVQFVVLSPEVTGDNLEDPKSQVAIRIYYRITKPDLVIITRDLDAPATNRAKQLKRKEFFNRLNRGLEGKCLFLLNIQAMEALIISHIAAFNARYGYVCEVPADPTTIADPVTFLKKATPAGRPRYDEGHCASLLAAVDYDTVLTNCRYFAEFDQEFARRLPTQA
ncbi:hypothetical protein GCM10027422_44800 [Hymenobacter arcticus]